MLQDGRDGAGDLPKCSNGGVQAGVAKYKTCAVVLEGGRVLSRR